jgi:CBS domain containing-hemolysin-like protein
MLDFSIGLISLILTLVVVLLRKVYFAVPLYELKRQAIKRDSFASTIYPLVAHGAILRGFLWFLLAVFSGVTLVLFNQFAPLWLGVVLVIVWIWLIFSWLPNRPPRKFSQYLAIVMVPVLSRVINAIYPIVKRAEKIAGFYPIPHTGVYEIDDLRLMLSRQFAQVDNRVAAKDLNRIEQLLMLDHTRIKEYITPLHKSMMIAADEMIGPKLLDDLHRSGLATFLVTSNKHSHQLIGILNKEDVDLRSEGKVSDFMRRPIRFINENESVEKALEAFALYGQPLIVVVNQDKELLGTLSLKDTLEVLLKNKDNNKLHQVEDNTELAIKDQEAGE